MNDWSITYLKDVSELITKGTTPTSVGGRFTDSGINFIKSESLNYDGVIDKSAFAFIDEDSNNKLKRSVLKEKDILYSIAGIYLGKMGVVKKQHLPANTNQACAIIRLRHDVVDYRFIKQYFSEKSFINYVNSLTGQAAQPNINLTDIGNLKLLLPPLPTQRRIASILSAYDELIEVNNQRIKLLEETARQLYKEWFVRMRFPGYKKAKFIKGVPEGWEVKSLYDIAEVTYGFPFQSELFNDKGEGIPVIRIRDLIEGSISTFTTEIADEKYYAEDGDILVGMDGDFHYCKWAAGRVWINQRNVRFRPFPKSNISRYFLYHVTKPHIEFLNEIIVGTTVAHLSATDLKKMKLLIPSEELLSAFKQISEPIYEQEIVLKQQNTQLRQIRDRLLPRLVSGKLAVKPLAAYGENEMLTMAAEG